MKGYLVPGPSDITLRADRNPPGLATASVAATCPVCRRPGTLNPIGVHDLQLREDIVVGFRLCPNPQCAGLILGVWYKKSLIHTYPSQPIEVDKTNIPDQIWRCFDEALKCYAEKCYRAAAMLVRRTLEEICKDQAATGADLAARLKALRSKVVLPNELLEGMDELRLLGNDAAHVEAKVYGDVGPEEVKLAIELTKEILKALYQLQHLLGQLQALKAAHAQQSNPQSSCRREPEHDRTLRR